MEKCGGQERQSIEVDPLQCDSSCQGSPNLQARCERANAELAKKEAHISTLQTKHDALLEECRLSSEQVSSLESPLKLISSCFCQVLTFLGILKPPKIIA